MSREFKVGLLTLISIIIFVFGFNYLKGTLLFKKQKVYYALFEKVPGLNMSDPVNINGIPIGKVTGLVLLPKNDNKVLATFLLNPEHKIPVGSTALLNSDILGDKSINLILTLDNGMYYQPDDTINTEIKQELIDQLGAQITPITDKLDVVVMSIDTLLKGLNVLFNRNNEDNLYNTIASINDVLDNLKLSTSELSGMMTNDNSSINKSLSNIENLTSNLNKNNQKLDNMINQFSNLSDTLIQANIGQTFSNTRDAINELSDVLAKMNEGDGTIGELMNNPAVFENLESSTANLNKLLTDLKDNPSRYVHFSLFGKKDKTDKTPKKGKEARDDVSGL